MDHTVQLAQQNPEVHAEFMKGNFVVQKSRRQFSLMAKEQAHEQSNKILQTNGGAAESTVQREGCFSFFAVSHCRCIDCVVRSHNSIEYEQL